MKKILTAILILISVQLFAQEYSIVNFISQIGPLRIYINDQLIGSLNRDETLEYKLYSEGKLSVTIVSRVDVAITNIEVKKGNIYYITIPYSQIVTEERAYEFYESTKVIQGEEDQEKPYIVAKSTSSPKQGTCFLINKQGYLLTNYHVVNGAKTIQIKGIGNDFSTLYGADIVAFDIDLDLAILKLKNPNITFPAIPYQISTETIPQGAKTFTLGYPLTNSMGEEIKITEGIINAKSGYKGTISQYQFSASVQPGNSGSPLFNEKGDVIGIVNAKLQGAEGAGYAIKSPYIISFLKMIENLQTENNVNTLSKDLLSDKVTKLKNFIFIVKTE